MTKVRHTMTPEQEAEWVRRITAPPEPESVHDALFLAMEPGRAYLRAELVAIVREIAPWVAYPDQIVNSLRAGGYIAARPLPLGDSRRRGPGITHVYTRAPNAVVRTGAAS